MNIYRSLVISTVALCFVGEMSYAQISAPQKLNLKKSSSTGTVTFVTPSDGGTISIPNPAGRRLQPMDFFHAHGSLFGINDPVNQLKFDKVDVDRFRQTHTTFQQVHKGVTVFSGVMKVHQDQAGDILAVNGDFYPLPDKLNVQPTLTLAEAQTKAKMILGDPQLHVEHSELVIVDPGWYGDRPIGPHLAYYVILNNFPIPQREAFFIDAHTGKTLDRWNLLHTILDRSIWNDETSTWARLEGEPPTGDLEVDAAYDFGGDWYDYFLRGFGRDSYDGFGSSLVTTVHLIDPACPNAFGGGGGTWFCDGLVTDDIVAHEWGHNLTESTANLIYQNQSGQLNESYSDVWGEIVDMFNGDAAFPGAPGGTPWPTHPSGSGTDTPNDLRTGCVGGVSLDLNFPPSIAGTYLAQRAAFGPTFTELGITSEVALVDPVLACSAIANPSEINGKIAFVDRGDCNFTDKVQNCQNAGAIAVIVANNIPGPPITLGGASGAITIPSLMVAQDDGSLIRDELEFLSVVNVTLKANSTSGGVRWLHGEDASPNGASRDLWEPTCMGDPDRANHPFQVCNPQDGGGVHSGSGIPNHAFAMLTDGKSFNGYTINGIGPIKAAAVWYRALTVYLTPSSDFEDAYLALNQAANDLVGDSVLDPRDGSVYDIFTSSDAAEVDKALLATEMNTPGLCGSFDEIVDVTPFMYEWTLTYGGSDGDNDALAVTSDANGNIISVGRFTGTADFDPSPGVDLHTSVGNFDIFVTVILQDGTYSWTRTIGDTGWDEAVSVAVDVSNNIYFTGRFSKSFDFDPTAGVDIHTSRNNSQDAYVTKLGSDGSYHWTYSFGGDITDVGHDIAITDSGDVIVVGSFFDEVFFDTGAGEVSFPSNGNDDAFVTKLTSDGNYAWAHTFGGFSFDAAESVDCDITGNVYVTGLFSETVDFDSTGVGDVHVSNGRTDIFITSIQNDGSYNWTIPIGGTGSDTSEAIDVDSDGNLFIGGKFGGTVDFDPGIGVDERSSQGDFSAFLVRFSILGDYHWARTFKGSRFVAVLSITRDDQSTIIVGGNFVGEIDFDPEITTDFRTSSGSDAYISAYNLDGIYGWTHSFGSTGNDRALSVSIPSTNHVLATGTFANSVDFNPLGISDIHTSSGGTDAWITQLEYPIIETPGACCLGPDCEIVGTTQCTDLEGVFQGPGTDCVSAGCEALYGACCVNFQCEYVLEEDCTSLEGVFQGASSVCDVDLCGPGAASGWSTFQHDAQRTGRTAAILRSPSILLWDLNTSTSNAISPTIGPGGTIYAKSEQHFNAVNPDGSIKWSADLGGGVLAPPAIRKDGHFFLPSKYSYEDGSNICGTPVGSTQAPALDQSGNCYYAGSIGKMDPGCNIQWIYNTSSATSHIALGHNGSVYSTIDFELIALTPDNGFKLWSYPTPGEAGAPAIGSDDTIYLHYAPNILLALNPDGSEKWSYTLTGLSNIDAAPSPAIGTDDTVYVFSLTESDRHPTLVAVSSSGEELWRFSEPYLSGHTGLSPIIDGNGTVLFPIQGNDLIALSPIDGSELWRIDLGDDFVNTSPAIGEDGTLYLTTANGYLNAYGDCKVAEPVLSDPTGINKSRYISFIPSNSGNRVAIRVTLTDLDGFSEMNQQIRWVGPPQIYQESGVPEPTFFGAKLRCEPHFQDWSDIDLLHVFGSEIVPNSTYDIEVIDLSCAGGQNDESVYSSQVICTTSKWGDVVEPYHTPTVTQPSISDILALVDKWLGSLHPIKARAQLQPNMLDPSTHVGIADILTGVDAWLGTPYPYDGPQPCE